MNIVVCIKQTPVAAEARLNEATKTLVREGVTLTVSSLDRRALLEAVRLRSQVGGTVTVITMGPPQAKSALVELMGLGADRAVHLSDPLFAGADTLATAQALSLAMRRLNPDLVMCGRFTIDSETGQVPSELAELLGIPQVTAVRKISPTEHPGLLWVEREADHGYEQYDVRLPALLSVTELIISTRRPTPEEMEAGGKKPLEVWNAADLGADPSKIGAAGSPTRVAGLRSAGLERKGTVVSGDNPEEAAHQLVNYLIGAGMFQPGRKQSTRNPRRRAAKRQAADGGIWVVAELHDGKPRPVTYELLGKAQELAETMGGQVACVLLGGSGIEEHVPAMGAYGADTVYMAKDFHLSSYDTSMYTTVLASAIQEFHPRAVLVPSTTNGRDLAPRVAARLQVGLTGDCVGLEVDEQGALAQLKPAFGGNIVSPIYSRTTPIMATVRPGMMTPCEPDWSFQPRVIPLGVSVRPDPRVKLLKTVNEPGLGPVSLDEADVVIAVGQGVGGPDSLPVLRQLADSMNAALAISLRVATAGWLPPQLQVGLTGKALAPHFYFAVAISGQPNHLIGVKKAEHIVAINNDPKAPVFQSADFGIVGDWAKVIPAVTRAVLEAREQQQPSPVSSTTSRSDR